MSDDSTACTVRAPCPPGTWSLSAAGAVRQHILLIPRAERHGCHAATADAGAAGRAGSGDAGAGGRGSQARTRRCARSSSESLGLPGGCGLRLRDLRGQGRGRPRTSTWSSPRGAVAGGCPWSVHAAKRLHACAGQLHASVGGSSAAVKRQRVPWRPPTCYGSCRGCCFAVGAGRRCCGCGPGSSCRQRVGSCVCPGSRVMGSHTSAAVAQGASARSSPGHEVCAGCWFMGAGQQGMRPWVIT